MQHIIDYAKSEGLHELHGAVLGENSTMLRMCAEIGFSVEEEPGNNSLRRVVLTLDDRDHRGCKASSMTPRA